MSARFFYGFLLVAFLTGCTSLVVKQFDVDYGVAKTQDRLVEASTVDGDFYYHQIKPILDNRCVVCHGCYDAPCQLKLSSPEGIDRGLTNQRIYARRLKAMNPTRLFEDAQSTDEWRLKGFNAVLNERQQTAEANLQAGLLYKMLELKKNSASPKASILDKEYDFSLNRAEICPTIETYDSFAEKHPNWGMPFGLPALSDDEFSKIEAWLANGAIMSKQPPLSPQLQQQIVQWESFLNMDSNKHKLMSRYIYEHLFLAHLYFEEQPEGVFFKIVRSKTPPGQAIDIIATRHPYDDPSTKRVYYRLAREQATILEKTHLPYRMDEARMQRWQQLFLDAKYQVEALPSYDVKTTANPFISFQSIPVNTKYRFLLDDAQIFIMGFIKGPVCRGELALDVIEDNFWVFFEDPDIEDKVINNDFLAQQSNNLRLPIEDQGAISVLSWKKYAELQRSYFQARDRVLANNKVSLDINSVWDGDGHNKNSALTVFRHFDNATVVQGMVGEQPKTAWGIDYALFERIHYLLVAGYDPFGNISHGLTTRLYMDFLRIEAELNFALLLPADSRKKELEHWYRGAEEVIHQYIGDKTQYMNRSSNIHYDTENHKHELFQKIQHHLSDVPFTEYGNLSDPNYVELSLLKNIPRNAISILPEIIFVRVTASDKKEAFYTVINNRGYANVTSLLGESNNRLPSEDDLTIVSGFLGSYPSVFWDVKSTDLNALVDQAALLSSENDYRKLLDTYGVRRTSEQFWDISDQAHASFKENNPIEAGLFDYNRLENR